MGGMKTIAVIDDDVHINGLLYELLTQEGYRVLRAWSGTEALLLLQTKTPDLILLDLMLPGLQGEEVLPRLKGIPVIVVSARAAVQDKVELLLGGAADYITKPFDTQELLARIQVQLRKAQGPASAGAAGGCLRFGILTMDTGARLLTANGQPVRLTRTEFALLRLLMENPSQVLTKSQLLERLCEDTPDCVESSLKVHISNLRRKLREAGAGDCIEAVWGIGFKLAKTAPARRRFYAWSAACRRRTGAAIPCTKENTATGISPGCGGAWAPLWKARPSIWG